MIESAQSRRKISIMLGAVWFDLQDKWFDDNSIDIDAEFQKFLDRYGILRFHVADIENIWGDIRKKEVIVRDMSDEDNHSRYFLVPKDVAEKSLVLGCLP